jgi:hypothetical protein
MYDLLCAGSEAVPLGVDDEHNQHDDNEGELRQAKTCEHRESSCTSTVDQTREVALTQPHVGAEQFHLGW